MAVCRGSFQSQDLSETLADDLQPLLCHLRCLRMIGGVTLAMGRMTRSRAVE